jgi:hypothetical protein
MLYILESQSLSIFKFVSLVTQGLGFGLGLLRRLIPVQLYAQYTPDEKEEHEKGNLFRVIGLGLGLGF